MKKIDQNYKFVILGGGTAGFLTALFIKNRFVDSNVTVITSSQLGVIGAGEGTTPIFIKMLDYLNVPLSDVFKHADATFKTGINFSNWTGDGSSYFHGFFSYDPETNYNHLDLDSDYNIAALNCIVKQTSLDDINFGNLISKKYLSPLSGLTENDVFVNAFGLHFNAAKLADYLQGVCLSRNINVIDDIVEGIELNDEEEVVGLKCQNHFVETDFLFDCSGFSRLVIGQYFKSEWKSYEDFIPNDSALPFFLDIDDKFHPHTESTAMDNGWVWKIPTKKRYGCGYVYSSKFTTVEDVKKEIIEKFGDKITFPRNEPFKFKAGSFKDTWKNNCVALGLSSGFIEPLEATSILVLISSLFEFQRCVLGLTAKDKDYIERYNKKVFDMNHQVAEFVYLHYLGRKGFNDYWNFFHDVDTEKCNLGDIEKIYALSGKFIPNNVLSNKVFLYHSYVEVMTGLNMFDLDKNKQLFDNVVVGSRQYELNNSLSLLKHNISISLNKLVDHSSALHFLSV